jgi:hypothetical protein
VEKAGVGAIWEEGQGGVIRGIENWLYDEEASYLILTVRHWS